MPSFTVQCDTEEYRIVADSGEESSTVEYGSEPACLAIDGDIYYCLMDDPDEQSPVVYRVASVDECHTTSEDVTFGDDDEEEEIEAGPVLVETENAG